MFKLNMKKFFAAGIYNKCFPSVFVVQMQIMLLVEEQRYV